MNPCEKLQWFPFRSGWADNSGASGAGHAIRPYGGAYAHLILGETADRGYWGISTVVAARDRAEPAEESLR
jgi:hypothetical protein